MKRSTNVRHVAETYFYESNADPFFFVHPPRTLAASPREIALRANTVTV